MLMHYLFFLGGRAATEGWPVEQQVPKSNPVLEAFGNAKAIRNKNSRSCYQNLFAGTIPCMSSYPERNYQCFCMLYDAPQEVHNSLLVDKKSMPIEVVWMEILVSLERYGCCWD